MGDEVPEYVLATQQTIGTLIAKPKMIDVIDLSSPKKPGCGEEEDCPSSNGSSS